MKQKGKKEEKKTGRMNEITSVPDTYSIWNNVLQLPI